MTADLVWPGADGAPISCREKLRTLAENQAELRQVMQDAFEDAVLMGVDEAAMRRILTDTVVAAAQPQAARDARALRRGCAAGHRRAGADPGQAGSGRSRRRTRGCRATRPSCWCWTR